MNNFLMDIINDYGYFGIGFLIMLENVFPPIPSEVILLFGGFSVTYAGLNIYLVVLFSTLGSFFGAVILFLIGSYISKEKLYKLVTSKYGKMLFIKTKHIDSAENWFLKKGSKTVFFCRFVPIVRSLISIPAGMSKISFIKFSFLTILGSAIWNTVIVFLGYLSGNAWEKMVKYFDYYSYAILFILGALVLAFAIYYKRKKKREISDDENQ